jgi:hypothetical protein
LIIGSEIMKDHKVNFKQVSSVTEALHEANILQTQTGRRIAILKCEISTVITTKPVVAIFPFVKIVTIRNLGEVQPEDILIIDDSLVGLFSEAKYALHSIPRQLEGMMVTLRHFGNYDIFLVNAGEIRKVFRYRETGNNKMEELRR